MLQIPNGDHLNRKTGYLLIRRPQHKHLTNSYNLAGFD